MKRKRCDLLASKKPLAIPLRKRFFASERERQRRLDELLYERKEHGRGMGFDLAVARLRAEQALDLVGLSDIVARDKVLMVVKNWAEHQVGFWNAWKRLPDAPHFVFFSELAMWADVNKGNLARWKKSKKKSEAWLDLAEQTIKFNEVPLLLFDKKLLGKRATRFWKILTLGTLRERVGRKIVGHKF